MSDIKLLDVNNDWQQARPVLKFADDSCYFSGYQNFKLSSKEIIALSDNTKLKYDLVKNTITADVAGKSVSDVGCSNMFFGYYAYLHGASKVTGVDLDLEYIDLNKKIIQYFQMSNVNIENINAADYVQLADTVFAFAIIHWVYSCTGFLGSLKNVIKHFKSITGECLYIEWIDPSDDCIKDMLHHLDFNKEYAEQDFNKENFLKYLNENFSSVTHLGNSKITREIYRCLV